MASLSPAGGQRRYIPFSTRLNKGRVKVGLPQGMDEDFIKDNFIAFASDGASAMLGRKSGVAAHLQLLYPQLIVWHCLNHSLELAVGDTVKQTNNVNHFKSFLDKIYTLYQKAAGNWLSMHNNLK